MYNLTVTTALIVALSHDKTQCIPCGEIIPVELKDAYFNQNMLTEAVIVADT